MSGYARAQSNHASAPSVVVRSGTLLPLRQLMSKCLPLVTQLNALYMCLGGLVVRLQYLTVALQIWQSREDGDTMAQIKQTWERWAEAHSRAMFLYEKWVSFDKKLDLDRIHASMLQEARWHRTGKSGASAGLISETKGELILLGKIRKVLATPWS
jgi:hypothetical protein